jgi:hypothetical protein
MCLFLSSLCIIERVSADPQVPCIVRMFRQSFQIVEREYITLKVGASSAYAV